jgi:hypothetical protein
MAHNLPIHLRYNPWWNLSEMARMTSAKSVTPMLIHQTKQSSSHTTILTYFYSFTVYSTCVLLPASLEHLVSVDTHLTKIMKFIGEHGGTYTSPFYLIFSLTPFITHFIILHDCIIRILSLA